jgi:hypothetical protein
MKIAAAEKLSSSDIKVFAAFAFCHDNYRIRRIMDARVRELEDRGLIEEAAALLRQKREQRVKHMLLGARRAEKVLRSLEILSERELTRCRTIIEKHDLWKLGEPWPLADDRLALCCFEADALWPLQPLGVLADIERSGEDAMDPEVWRRKVQESHRTMIVYRANWAKMKEPFQGRNSIFRTPEGHRIYKEWRRFWGLPA